MKKTVYLLLSFLLILFLSVLAFTQLFGYTQTIDNFTSLSGLDHYRTKIFELIDIRKFHMLQLILLIVCFILAVTIYFFQPLYRSIVKYLNNIRHSFKMSVLQNFQLPFLFILIVPFFTSLYYAIKIPISYDEAWTYLNFSTRGIFASLAYYPAPNNHILHSIITVFTTKIPFLDDKICLRLPVLIVNMLICIILFDFIKKTYNSKIAVLIVAVNSMLLMNIYYSFLSRGYALLMLFFIVSFYAVVNIIKYRHQKYWIYFVVCSIFGFYTIPSYLYPFITLNIILFMYNYKSIRKQIYSNIIVVFSAVILYIPVVIVNGLDALSNNRFVKPIHRDVVLQRLPSFSSLAIKDITGFNWVLIAALLVIAFAVVVYRKKWNLVPYYLIFLAMPFLLLLIHSVIPYSRTFVYYSIILVFLIIIPFADYINKIDFRNIVILGVVIQGVLFVYQYKKVFQLEDNSLSAAPVIAEISGNKKYLCDDDYFSAYLLFELTKDKYKNYNLVYKNELMLNADTLNNFDYVIIAKNFDKTVVRKPTYENDYFRVYK